MHLLWYYKSEPYSLCTSVQPEMRLYKSWSRFFAIFRNFSARLSTSSLCLSQMLFFVNLPQMTHFILRMLFLELGFSLNVPKVCNFRGGASSISTIISPSLSSTFSSCCDFVLQRMYGLYQTILG